MSHNIIILGHGFHRQTTTKETEYVLKNAKGRNALEADLDALRLLKEQEIERLGVDPALQGIRNPYLITKWHEEVAGINQIYATYEQYIRSKGGRRRLIISN